MKLFRFCNLSSRIAEKRILLVSYFPLDYCDEESIKHDADFPALDAEGGEVVAVHGKVGESIYCTF